MKRLVICCDGTWNTRERRGPDGDVVTNVVKMARSIVPRAPDGTVQTVFYDEGVGTGLGLMDRFVGGGLGIGLGKNVGDAYRFLVDNYEPGDEIYFFGFSRGAFTARSTAGLVRKCGLLRKDEAHRFPEAFELYRSQHRPKSKTATDYRASYSREPRIHFLGVWDTVGALGIPHSPLRWFSAKKYEFHDVELSSIVDHAYHAVAIDERRRAFRPALWSTKIVENQHVQQVWFAGAHSGVGGGLRATGLSDQAFLWMKDGAGRAGLCFDEAFVAKSFRPDALGALVDSRRGLWRAMPGGWRPIGDSSHLPQSLHASAIQRFRSPTARYQPPNLAAYLDRHPTASLAPPEAVDNVPNVTSKPLVQRLPRPRTR